MKKFATFAIILVSLLFLTSCTNTGDKTKTPTQGFIGGTEGIVASWVAEEPPAKVYDADTYPFRLSLLLENKGEHDVPAGEVITTVEGIDYAAFQIANANQKNTMTIEGSKRDSTGKSTGGGKSNDIGYDSSFKNKVPASQPFTFGMNICYKYKTEASSSICLRKEITARALPKDVCKIEDKRTVTNSGAPISVTSVSESPAGKNQVRLFIEIANNGKGEVYEPNYLSKGTCTSDPSTKVQNNVKMKVSFADNGLAVKCNQFDNKNEGTLRLITNKAKIECFVDTANMIQTTTFTSPLNIEVDYVYKDFISKQVLVDKST